MDQKNRRWWERLRGSAAARREGAAGRWRPGRWERTGPVERSGRLERSGRAERAGRVRRPAWLRIPRTRKGQRRAVQGVMALCVVALLPATWLFVTTDSKIGSVADAPPARVAMVFGAGLWKGEPSPYLAHRLDAAAELYRAGRIEVVLVTGDNSREEYDEPDAMRAYLKKHGVPDRRIVSDYAGFDTWDSCVRAKKIFGVDRAVLISQGFHIRRAVALCGAAGVSSYGVGVDAVHDTTWYYGGAREVFAAGKAALDATLHPDPRFLGPRERGVERALASGR
ncbi:MULTISPECIES: SanA/YdcF family protein [Streptomyces]|uniref:SanA/YdcF family protein n=1 Tax=Streptomyces TaxID=1883 RepID=UPI001E550D60|nr:MULTISPECIES: ElyC/SanA/YdcF family protein [Streptomyces]UFQ15457.1 YdcF family protein [Streptomyces huasconensis]WCL85061.1 ElyC/SanA/YdcF family protein [Streptomyces sp. JCM 35825]